MVRRRAVSNEAGPSHGNTKRRKSSVWMNFDRADVPGGIAMASCKRCGSTFKADPKTHGTSHLLRHAKSSCCAKRAAERTAPCLPVAAAPVVAAAPPAPPPADDDDEEEELAKWKWVDDLYIDPEYDADLFSSQEQQDGGRLTTTDSPFTDGRQVDGGGEVAAAGDHDRRSPNSIPDTHMPQAQSSASMRFFRQKRKRSPNCASQQGGTTDKDHSSPVNPDWAPAVDNSMVDTDFTFGDAYD